MRRIFTVVVAAMLLTSVSQAQPTVTAALINHNIHSGGQPVIAAGHIEDLLDMTPQKGLVLCNEANYARQYFNLPYPGWHHKWPASPHEGRGNPIFTRDAAMTRLNSWKLVMTEPWTHNKPKSPRIYTAVKVQLVNNPWVTFHVINVHFPTNRTGNGPARQESIDRLIEFSDDHPGLPLIICGDFNMSKSKVQQRIGDEIGGQVYSIANVDHMVVRDGLDVGFDGVTMSNLGPFISDHDAIRYNFTFKALNDLVDNSDAGFTASGDWATGTSAIDKYGDDYRFRLTEPVSDPAVWAFDVPVAGDYEIYAWWSQGPNRSSTAPYILPDSTIVYRNQQTAGGSWQSLGTLNLSAGSHDVKLSCWTSNGSVVIGDAIKVVPR